MIVKKKTFRTWKTTPQKPHNQKNSSHLPSLSNKDPQYMLIILGLEVAIAFQCVAQSAITPKLIMKDI